MDDDQIATYPVGPWLRALGGVVVLALVVWWVGAGPFLEGARVVDATAVLAALGAGLVSTLCCVWRWRRVAAALGVDVPWHDGFAAYYRSQFLNATLPGGVVGDVHRALRHGRQIGDVRAGARAVVLERAGGLSAQVGLAAAALLALRSPLPSWLALTLVTAGVVALAIAARAPRRSPDVASRVAGTVVVVVLSSGIALAGHLAVFVIAARAAGVTAPLPALVALTLPALLAMALPFSIAGWGPREGVAAWAFASAGLGATQGVTTAVAYGALALVGCLPGAAVLVAGWLRSVVPARRRSVVPARRPIRAVPPPAPAFEHGGPHD